MKKIALVSLVVFAFLGFGCNGLQNVQARRPAGYKVCQMDSDCAESEYCGFIAVDTYPVCRGGNYAEGIRY